MLGQAKGQVFTTCRSKLLRLKRVSFIIYEIFFFSNIFWAPIRGGTRGINRIHAMQFCSVSVANVEFLFLIARGSFSCSKTKHH